MARNIFKRLIALIRNQFLAGMLIIVPLGLTAIIIIFLFDMFDNILAPVIYGYLGEYYFKGMGVVILILLIWFIGLITKNYFGKQLVGLYETIILKIPMLNSIFGSIKQISDTLLSGKSKSFKDVVLVNFPFYGVYAIGFITSGTTAGLKLKSKKDEVVHIFMPTTPNPTSGYLLLVPLKNIIPLDISVEEGLKLVVSMGVVHPNHYSVKPVKKTLRKIQTMQKKTRREKKTPSVPSLIKTPRGKKTGAGLPSLRKRKR